MADQYADIANRQVCAINGHMPIADRTALHLRYMHSFDRVAVAQKYGSGIIGAEMHSSALILKTRTATPSSSA